MVLVTMINWILATAWSILQLPLSPLVWVGSLLAGHAYSAIFILAGVTWRLILWLLFTLASYWLSLVILAVSPIAFICGASVIRGETIEQTFNVFYWRTGFWVRQYWSFLQGVPIVHLENSVKYAIKRRRRRGDLGHDNSFNHVLLGDESQEGDYIEPLEGDFSVSMQVAFKVQRLPKWLENIAHAFRGRHRVSRAKVAMMRGIAAKFPAHGDMHNKAQGVIARLQRIQSIEAADQEAQESANGPLTFQIEVAQRSLDMAAALNRYQKLKWWQVLLLFWPRVLDILRRLPGRFFRSLMDTYRRWNRWRDARPAVSVNVSRVIMEDSPWGMQLQDHNAIPIKTAGTYQVRMRVEMPPSREHVLDAEKRGVAVPPAKLGPWSNRLIQKCVLPRILWMALGGVPVTDENKGHILDALDELANQLSWGDSIEDPDWSSLTTLLHDPECRIRAASILVRLCEHAGCLNTIVHCPDLLHLMVDLVVDPHLNPYYTHLHFPAHSTVATGQHGVVAAPSTPVVPRTPVRIPPSGARWAESLPFVPRYDIYTNLTTRTKCKFDMRLLAGKQPSGQSVSFDEEMPEDAKDNYSEQLKWRRAQAELAPIISPFAIQRAAMLGDWEVTADTLVQAACKIFSKSSATALAFAKCDGHRILLFAMTTNPSRRRECLQALVRMYVGAWKSMDTKVQVDVLARLCQLASFGNSGEKNMIYTEFQRKKIIDHLNDPSLFGRRAFETIERRRQQRIDAVEKENVPVAGDNDEGAGRNAAGASEAAAKPPLKNRMKNVFNRIQQAGKSQTPPAEIEDGLGGKVGSSPNVESAISSPNEVENPVRKRNSRSKPKKSTKKGTKRGSRSSKKKRVNASPPAAEDEKDDGGDDDDDDDGESSSGSGSQASQASDSRPRRRASRRMATRRSSRRNQTDKNDSNDGPMSPQGALFSGLADLR